MKLLNLLIFLSVFVLAEKSPAKQKRVSRRWPHLAFKEKPFTKKRLEAIHEIVNGWPDDGSSYDYNETMAEWHQPVEITPEMYAELQKGGMEVPWLIVFLRTERSQP